MKIFSALLLLFLALCGVVFLLRELSLLLFRNEKESSVLLVTFSGDDPEEVECVLRSALSRARWGKGIQIAVCSDCREDSEAEKICRRLCRQYAVKLIDKSQLLAMIQNSNLEL